MDVSGSTPTSHGGTFELIPIIREALPPVSNAPTWEFAITVARPRDRAVVGSAKSG